MGKIGLSYRSLERFPMLLLLAVNSIPSPCALRGNCSLEYQAPPPSFLEPKPQITLCPPLLLGCQSKVHEAFQNPVRSLFHLNKNSAFHLVLRQYPISRPLTHSPVIQSKSHQ